MKLFGESEGVRRSGRGKGARVTKPEVSISKSGPVWVGDEGGKQLWRRDAGTRRCGWRGGGSDGPARSDGPAGSFVLNTNATLKPTSLCVLLQKKSLSQ